MKTKEGGGEEERQRACNLDDFDVAMLFGLMSTMQTLLNAYTEAVLFPPSISHVVMDIRLFFKKII